jgi:glycerol-3-phosphate dehydrogenase
VELNIRGGSVPSRELASLTRNELDVLIVGGGIVGVGIARDLALRGARIGLVEQRDWGSGTTSRPTRLIHGGLRYLELFDFGLVRSDLREREILLRIASYLVRPLPFLLPIYRRSPFFRAKLWTGMRLYDLLSFDKSLPGRHWLNRSAVLKAEPGLNPHGLRGAWQFYDAQVPLVERLVVANLVDAAAHGAIALNYATMERLLRDGSRVVGARVRLEDGRSGDVRARLVVNATGPWLDLTSGELRPAARPLLRLTKGVHLVAPASTNQAHVLFARSDGRLFFVIPWLGQTLIGTTDTDFRDDPGRAAADASDVAYLLAEAARAFPSASFTPLHYTMAGVRALVRTEGVSEGHVSRKHAIHDHLAHDGIDGAISVVGGKLTAYRGIAEEVADLAARRIGLEAGSTTASRPLPGADGDLRAVAREAAMLAEHASLTEATSRHLLNLYGARSLDVLELALRDPRLRLPVVANGHDILAQVAHGAAAEQALHLGDLLLRRCTAGLAPQQGLEDLDGMVERVGATLGWTVERRRAEAEAYRAELEPMRRPATLADPGFHVAA